MSKLFLLPAILVPILIGVIPFFLGVGLSFTDWCFYQDILSGNYQDKMSSNC